MKTVALYALAYTVLCAYLCAFYYLGVWLFHWPAVNVSVFGFAPVVLGAFRMTNGILDIVEEERRRDSRS